VARRDALFDETTPALAGGDVNHESRFPHEMCNAATTCASTASTDVAAYDDLPGYHLLVARNLIATNDESYHGSANEMPHAISHGYTEWDFSGLLDPVMF
jgi:hypothetical protein